MANLGEDLKFKYEPIWEQAPTDMKFHYVEIGEDGSEELKINIDKFKLISSLDELREYVSLCKDKIIGFDTETTGLSYGIDKIVGFSLSLDRYSGIYVPIRHQDRLKFESTVERKDENGNVILTKLGRPSKTKVVTYEYLDSADNLDAKEALDLAYQILTNAKMVLMHNSEFDLNMLKFEGYDPRKIRTFDTLILPYLYDPEATGLANLKALEKRVLGRVVPEFKDVLGKKYDSFTYVPPKDGYVYACCDTSGVIGIYEEMYPVVKELLQRFKNPLVFDNKIYNVLNKDNQMVGAFVDYYGHAKILIDRAKAIKYKSQLEQERKEIIAEIYSFFDRGMFNLSTSSNEFKEVMASKNLFTGVKTNKGADSWGKKAAGEMKRNLNKIKDALDNWRTIPFDKGVLYKDNLKAAQLAQMLLIYGNSHFKMTSTPNQVTFKGLKNEPVDIKYFWVNVKHLYKEEMEKLRILSLIQKNNSVNKSLNSYVEKLTQVDECYMHYRLKGTKSGRLSSGNGARSDKSRNHYYIDLNAQNLTKPASAYYSAEKCPETDPESILGWKFKPLEEKYALEHLKDLYIVEGQDPGITIRGCLIAPKGRYVVSLDYDAQEYKLMAILSGDSKMLENFAKGIDPHTASAYAIWGEENYNKVKRKKAKIFNFLNNYSGGAHTLSQQLDITVAEAEEMIKKYNETFLEMVAWKNKEIDKMYNNENVVFNAFGRPRQFKGWMNAINKNMDMAFDNLLVKKQVFSASNRVQSAVERRVSSHIIQGTAGDILRQVMLTLYKRYFKNRDPHIDFLSTVHDEINYTIDKEYTIQYIKELEDIMTFDTLNPDLPITTSTDIGFTYGNMFPFVWTDETKSVLIPKRVSHA